MRLDEQPSVLLTESDPVIGMDLSDALERAGYRVLGPIDTMAEARQRLETDTPTLAIVDVVLKDGRCTHLVRELRQRGIPFLIHSGCRQDQRLTGDIGGAPWLGKPALPVVVLALLDEMSPLRLNARERPMSKLPSFEANRATSGSRNPLITKLEGFAALSDEDRAVLEQISAEPRSVAPHTDLVREGDKPDGVILVMEGMACRHKVRANGARQISAYLVPGDLCDLDVALLDAMDHTITTLSACKVVRIAPEVIANLLTHHPQITRALRKSTLVDEATLREWLMNVSRRSAIERLAHLFCELLLRLRVVGLTNGNSYELPLTLTELADTTGLTSVHVNRSLRDLRRQGLIDLDGHQLKILDYVRLRALAEFKANYLHLEGQAAA